LIVCSSCGDCIFRSPTVLVSYLVETGIEPLHKVPVLFSSTSMTVRFGFGLSNNSGSIGSVRLAKDVF